MPRLDACIVMWHVMETGGSPLAMEPPVAHVATGDACVALHHRPSRSFAERSTSCLQPN